MHNTAFTRASNLQRHVACVHEDVRRFACTMCEKSFKRKRDLDGHMFAAHLQITPFVCEHPGCDRAFARQEQLRIHRKAHEYATSVGDSPFVSPAVLAAAAVAAAATANGTASPSAIAAAAAAIAFDDANDGVPPPPPPPPARRRKRAKRSDDNDSDDEYRDGYHATATNYRHAPPKQTSQPSPTPTQPQQQPQQQPQKQHHHNNNHHHQQPNVQLLHAHLPNLLAPLQHMHSLTSNLHLVNTPATATTTTTTTTTSTSTFSNGASFPHINDSLLNLAFTHSGHHQSSSTSSLNLSAILSPRSVNDEPDFKRPMLNHHEQLSRGLFAIPGAPVPLSARASLSAAIGQADAAIATAAASTAAGTTTTTNGGTTAAGSGTGATNTATSGTTKPSVGGTPTVLTAFLDAAHQNFLVKHENHVDALIDGRLLSLNHRFEEHDISTVIEFCDDARMQHTDDDCDHDHHGHDHHGKGHGEKKTEVLSPLEAHHQHAIGCGHIAVQHGDHTDFLVGHHLHHPAAGEDGHCVNHGHINMLSIDALYADGGLDATSWRELFAAESLFSASTATN